MCKFSCIVLAGGSGTRFGSKKQFDSIKEDGEKLWEMVYSTCLEVSDDVVVVGVDCEGGSTRRESVFIGLQHIIHDRVVIVEAARPFVTPTQIKDIGLSSHESCTYVMPSIETVLYEGEHLDRKECVILQTPQAFDTAMLIEAHIHCLLRDVTDDTLLMKNAWGTRPRFFEGGPNLHKITYDFDMEILKCLQF